MPDLGPPRVKYRSALSVWRRNVLVWRKLIAPALVINFGEPLLYLLGLGYGLGFYIGKMAGMPYLTFLASGIMTSAVMNTASFEGLYSVYTRMVPQQTYAAILATPVDVDDIVAGEALWCATKGLLSGAAILVVAVLLGLVHNFNALWVLPVMVLTGLCFASLALIVSALSTSYDFFNYYYTLVLAPLFFLCGIFYPITTFPAALQDLVQYLPLTPAVELMRPLVSGQPLTHVPRHLLVLSVYTVSAFYIATTLARRRLLT
ncbi:MAG: ABC transporter permease [Gammaproteobacteria bacterium]|nr:ABC transporter permease [Gammaproteobacteria bacterium]